MTRIIDVEYTGQYNLDITYSNGERMPVDLTELIKKPAYQSLESISEFKQFGLVRGTLEWSNGLDVAPEYLYELGQIQVGVKTK